MFKTCYTIEDEGFLYCEYIRYSENEIKRGRRVESLSFRMPHG